jgi:hypothetical protein
MEYEWTCNEIYIINYNQKLGINSGVIKLGDCMETPYEWRLTYNWENHL